MQKFTPAAAAALALLILLSGCETTGSISQATAPEALKDSGVVLFTVTHDKDMSSLARRGGNITLFVELRDLDRGTDLQKAFSTQLATLAPTIASSFDAVWGRTFVRELPPGRYAFTGWSAFQDFAYFSRSYAPKSPPPARTFEVAAGSITYLGNIHGRLAWGKNPLGVDLLGGAMPEFRNEAERDLAVILKEYPKLQGQVTVRPLAEGPWSSD